MKLHLKIATVVGALALATAPAAASATQPENPGRQGNAHKSMSPGQACKGTSGKHVKGEKGTPHSRCVAEAVKLKKELREEEAAQV
jgi:hypothetical protein